MRRAKPVIVVGAVVAVLVSVVAVLPTAGAAAAPPHRAPQQAAPPAAPPLAPLGGDYQVGRRTIMVPSADGRNLPVDIWYPVDAAATTGVAKSIYRLIPGVEYPADFAYDAPPVSGDGPFPLVVYSHGSGGLRYIASYFTERLAAAGFVVVAPDHLGNTAVEEATKTESPPAVIAKERPADVHAVIDATLAATADPADPLSGAIDPKRIGVAGHSAGGSTALVTVSGREGVSADPRVRALVLMAPYVDPVTKSELAGIDVPTMMISGTRDTTTPIRTQTERVWKLLPGRPLYRVDLRGAAQQSFTDVCFYEQLVPTLPAIPQVLVDAVNERAKEGCTPKDLEIGRAQRLIDRYSIAFLERYLEGDHAAAKQLRLTDPKVVSFEVKR
jgi:predicted dienelactone hydrolase